jgi:hypothetical protein
LNVPAPAGTRTEISSQRGVVLSTLTPKSSVVMKRPFDIPENDCSIIGPTCVPPDTASNSVNRTSADSTAGRPSGCASCP